VLEQAPDDNCPNSKLRATVTAATAAVSTNFSSWEVTTAVQPARNASASMSNAANKLQEVSGNIAFIRSWLS